MPDISFLEDLKAVALDALGIGIIVTDREARVLYANEASRQILAGPLSALRLGAGRILSAGLSETTKLEILIAGACSATAEVPGVPEHLLVPGRDCASPDLALCVAPASQTGHAVLLVRVIERECNLEAEARRLFGLTRTEAKFASALASGRSLEDAAGIHGVSRATARFHMKGIFRKTGVCRQSQVAALLRGVHLPIHRPRGGLETRAALSA